MFDGKVPLPAMCDEQSTDADCDWSTLTGRAAEKHFIVEPSSVKQVFERDRRIAVGRSEEREKG